MAPRREHPLARLQRDFDSLIESLWGGRLNPFAHMTERLRIWDFDVTENEREIVVRAELPGFDENELDVQLTNDTLTIKAEREQKGEEQEECRSFRRSVTLPSAIDPENVQATYHNGVLELHIPRAEGAQPRRIKIQGQHASGEGKTREESQQGTNAPAANVSSRGTSQH
jgi:HSP20 family protein